MDTDAYRAALDLLASHRYPFADLSRHEAPLEEVEPLLQAMAGEGGTPPVHGVVRRRLS